MNLSWTVLGAGTAAPHPKRSPSGHVITYGSQRILVDMGAGTLWRLVRAGIHWTTLDAIVLSHAHLDHTLDLQSLMFTSRVPGHGRTRPLPLYVGPGMDTMLGKLRDALGEWFEPGGFEVPVHVQQKGQVSIGALTVEFSPVEHHATSIGIKVIAPEGDAIAYSGDSAACDALVDLCQGAALAVLECSTRPDNPVRGHMTPHHMAEVARKARVPRVAAVHRYPELDGFDVAQAAAEAGYGGEVLVPGDGEVVFPPQTG
ncbi:MAG: ribonuclease Z [Myxococcota bacterium]